MTDTPAQPVNHLPLLPQPRDLRGRDGVFDLGRVRELVLLGGLEPPEIAAAEWFGLACQQRAGVRLQRRSGASPADGEFVVGVDDTPGAWREAGLPNDPDRAAQAYRLSIRPGRIELFGRSSVGVFHGIQTLHQLLRLCGTEWPALDVCDAPDFAVRGLSFDVSRGRVPTLETLKLLADRLALLKANQLQLYVEHTFAFAFDPGISSGSSPLTPDEIRELDAYCRVRRIELVPALASCGHMARVLSLPRYRHLAEIEGQARWEQMPWRARVRGLTLDVSNPESRRLLAAMYAEYLPLFSAGKMNVCCDETFDLGQGRGQRRAAEIGGGRMLLEHLCWLHELCGQYGKQMLFWGDMLKKHPELVREMPRDAVALNWGYAADADYDSTALFCDAGLTTYVCPGTSGWNRFVPDLPTADANIRRYAAAGRHYGAAGLLNTDWGDEGHVGPLATVWHPVALGAALAWNADAPGPEAFDAAFARLFLGRGGAAAVAAWRQANAASDMVRIWPAFCTDVGGLEGPANLDAAALERWRARAAEAAAAFAAVAPDDADAAVDREELVLAFRLHELAGWRLALERGQAGDWPAFADACEHAVSEYEAQWRARHKASCLREVTAVFERVSSQARARVGGKGRQ